LTTPKFMEYYAINQNHLKLVVERIKDRFSPEELAQFDKMLKVISQELLVEASERLQIERRNTLCQ